VCTRREKEEKKEQTRIRDRVQEEKGRERKRKEEKGRADREYTPWTGRESSGDTEYRVCTGTERR
jgi:hypothetical protein